MWWKSQNLDKPVQGLHGSIWHFRVSHGRLGDTYTEHVYFWDEPRQITGCAEFPADQSLHVSKLKQRIRKIAVDPTYRQQFLRELRFPVERHYPEAPISAA